MSGIGTLVKVNWTNLRRDRVAQLLAFLLPVIFFSIFATVFGNQGNASTARIRVAVVDEDHSDFSSRLVTGLGAEKGLRVRTTVDPEGKGAPLDRAAAQEAGEERRPAGGGDPAARIAAGGVVVRPRRERRAYFTARRRLRPGGAADGVPACCRK